MEHARYISEARKAIEGRNAPAAHLLHWAALQMDAVELAMDLYRRLRAPGGQALLDEHFNGEPFASEIICVSTVVRTGMSVLDLCAAVAYRLTHTAGIVDGKEADLSWWSKYWPQERTTLPTSLEEWFTQLKSPREWDLLKDLRDKYTHQQVVRDAIIQGQVFRQQVHFPGESPEGDEPASDQPENPVDLGSPGIGPGSVHVAGDKIDPIDLLPRLYGYVKKGLFSFADAISIAYPI